MLGRAVIGLLAAVVAFATLMPAALASGGTGLADISPHFTCVGNGGTAEARLDLSGLHGAVTPTGSGAGTVLDVALTGGVSIDTDFSLTGPVRCRASRFASIALPTGLAVRLGAVFDFTSTAAVSGTASVIPDVDLAFRLSDRGFSDVRRGFQPGDETINLRGDGSLSLGLNLGFAITQTHGARTVTGVEGTVGPTVRAQLRSLANATCWTTTITSRARLQARAGVWPWLRTGHRLTTAPFGESTLPETCSGSAVTVTRPGDQLSTIGTPATLSIQATDLGGGTLLYAAENLPPGLTINHNTGVISGTPTTLGQYSVSVAARDDAGVIGQTSFTWTVQTGPRVPQR